MRDDLELDMSADPDEFVEAVAEFAARRVITREEADTLSDYARKRAWWISGVTQMDVANDAHQSILEAMRKGTPFEEWKKSARKSIEREWGRKDSARLQLIFRNATTSAYNAGRLEQIEKPHITAVRPYKMLDVVDDLRTSKVCSPFISPPVVLPWDHPRWLTLSPPLHHGCRSGIRSLRASKAEKLGIMTEAPTVEIEDGWGIHPSLAEPPKPSERDNPPDADLVFENALKAGDYDSKTKPVKIPSRFLAA